MQADEFVELMGKEMITLSSVLGTEFPIPKNDGSTQALMECMDTILVIGN